MSARDIMLAELPCNIVYGRDNAVDGTISALTAAGYSIIHDSENHGPTVERAAEIALSQIKELGLSNNPAYVNFEPSEIMAEKIYLSIRTMKGDTK